MDGVFFFGFAWLFAVVLDGWSGCDGVVFFLVIVRPGAQATFFFYDYVTFTCIVRQTAR